VPDNESITDAIDALLDALLDRLKRRPELAEAYAALLREHLGVGNGGWLTVAQAVGLRRLDAERGPSCNPQRGARGVAGRARAQDPREARRRRLLAGEEGRRLV